MKVKCTAYIIAITIIVWITTMGLSCSSSCKLPVLLCEGILVAASISDNHTCLEFDKSTKFYDIPSGYLISLSDNIYIIDKNITRETPYIDSSIFPVGEYCYFQLSLCSNRYRVELTKTSSWECFSYYPDILLFEGILLGWSAKGIGGIEGGTLLFNTGAYTLSPSLAELIVHNCDNPDDILLTGKYYQLFQLHDALIIYRMTEICEKSK